MYRTRDSNLQLSPSPSVQRDEMPGSSRTWTPRPWKPGNNDREERIDPARELAWRGHGKSAKCHREHPISAGAYTPHYPTSHPINKTPGRDQQESREPSCSLAARCPRPTVLLNFKARTYLLQNSALSSSTLKRLPGGITGFLAGLSS